ncbi:terpenoid synthase [Aspergillus taichungensis]|uniref:Terpenoid synthase n=1 Tax=Aspergillus taichungensis TaxID=482145 RepID=A0A2J5HII3_9EURO|nr:terpenoid synthase [Aspergillus taichungensis]
MSMPRHIFRDREIGEPSWIYKAMVRKQSKLTDATLAMLFHMTASPAMSSVDYISAESQVSKRCYEEVVNGFLGDISFQPPDVKFDPGLKRRVEIRLRSYGISPELITKIGSCIETATKISSYSYPFVSPEVLDAIALYATYVISIDDMTGEILPDLEKYCSQLVLGQVHEHELLRGFTRFLSDQPPLFGPFGGAMITKGTMEFIASAVVERNQNGVPLSHDAADYLVYFRSKTGVAEPFAFFCFPENRNPEGEDLGRYISAIPNIMLFLGYVNDLLSFYKEELARDDCPGFVHDYATVHRSSSTQALRQLRHSTLEEVQKIRHILAGDDRTAQRLNQFIYGYIFYHLSARRYKLDELRIPAGREARARVQELVQGRP